MGCINSSQAASTDTGCTNQPHSVSSPDDSDVSPAGPVDTGGVPAQSVLMVSQTMRRSLPPKGETTETETSEAIDRFLETCTLYQCAGSESQVAGMRVTQAVWDRRFDLGGNEACPIFTGSYAEGMPRAICGDVDIMRTLPDYPVVLFEPPPEDTTSLKRQAGYVVAESNQSQPAYIKLTVRGVISNTGSNLDINRSVVQDEKGQWLSGQRLIRQEEGEECEIHGPAIIQSIDHDDPASDTGDLVICLRCPTWPACAADFLHRSRPYGTPSQSLIQSIAAAGCHVVATGHPDSKDRDLEWRWSFSVAEKEIIHDMDRAVAGAMYELKLLKKHMWTDENIPVGICSYFFKTACLFVNERVPHTAKTSSLALVRQALDWLTQCYQKHSIPHYFIPDQNMVGHLPRDTCTEMAHTLIDMKSKLQVYVLCGLQKDPVIAEVVHAIQDSISFSPQSDATEVNTGVFLTALLEQGNVGQVLESASGRICPGNDMHRLKELEGDRSALKEISSVISSDLLLTKTPLEVVKIPEDVFLPVIDNMDHIVKAELVTMHVSMLHRQLGLMYLALSFYIAENLSSDIDTSSKDDTSSQDNKRLKCEFKKEDEETTGPPKYSPVLSAERICVIKSEEFLHKGIPLVLHNGFDDKGLSGYVHLTLYYFLTRQWQWALDTSNKAIVIADEDDDLMSNVNGLPYMYIDITSTIDTVLWKQDENLYQCLTQSGIKYFGFHPVPLAYYFQARLALRQGDIGLAQAALGKMTKLREKLLEVCQTSTDILIETVVCQLGVFLD